MEPYTVTLTSCGRFDLLEATLKSLLPRLEGPVADIVVVEDSGDRQVFDVVGEVVGKDATVLVNSARLGQMASIDLAYANVKTGWVFHCEDDWEFFSDGFVGKSFAILNAFAQVSMVSLRAREELNPLVRDSDTRRLDGIPYFVAEPSLHPEYFGYSFNPGLRRMSDYRKFAPFADMPFGERDISYCFKRLGYTMGYLEEPAVRHIGDDRHVDDPKLPRRARSLGHRLFHSPRKRWWRLHRRLDPDADPAVRIMRRLERAGSSHD